MSIELAWMDESRTIVHQKFSGAFTLNEYTDIEHQTHGMIGDVGHTVDIICDLSSARHLPSNLASLGRRAHHRPPANLGVTIIVGAPAYIRKLADFATRWRAHAVHSRQDIPIFVDSLVDARVYLAQHRLPSDI